MQNSRALRQLGAALVAGACLFLDGCAIPATRTALSDASLLATPSSSARAIGSDQATPPRQTADENATVTSARGRPSSSETTPWCAPTDSAMLGRAWREREAPKGVAFPGDPRGWEKTRYDTAELTPLGERFGIENAAPWLVAPTRDADSNHAGCEVSKRRSWFERLAEAPCIRCSVRPESGRRTLSTPRPERTIRV